MLTKPSIVMLGASGAVGGEALKALLASPLEPKITSLGRRRLHANGPGLVQQLVDVADPATYEQFLASHQAAICTLGVGQPSKTGKAEFTRIDKDAVLAFGAACKKAGIRHFSLLCSVGADAKSSSFYLRSKGETEEGLKALGFERLSLFRPSMILTPQNRYGLQQAIFLMFWPLLTPFLLGPLRKLRGIRVEELGQAMALNALNEGKPGVEILSWDEFQALTGA